MRKDETKKLNNSSEVALAQKTLRRQAVVAGASLVLVIALALSGTVAWYTRLVNVTGMTFDAAEFDIKADYVEASFIINPDDYSNVVDGKAAPGTQGVIPVTITATGSETDATYRLNVNNQTMAPEFTERIHFYYYTKVGDEYVRHELGLGQPDIEGTLPAGKEKVTEYIYWEWLYTADLSQIFADVKEETGKDVTSLDQVSNLELYETFTKGYSGWFPNFNSTGSFYYMGLGYKETLTTTIKTGGEDVVVTTTYPAVNGYTNEDNQKRGANIRDYIENHYMYSWDYVDTQVGLGYWDVAFTSRDGLEYEADEVTVEDANGDPETKTYTAYQMAMQVTLSIIGAQAQPMEEGAALAPDGAATVKYDPTT